MFAQKSTNYDRRACVCVCVQHVCNVTPTGGILYGDIYGNSTSTPQTSCLRARARAIPFSAFLRARARVSYTPAKCILALCKSQLQNAQANDKSPFTSRQHRAQMHIHTRSGYLRIIFYHRSCCISMKIPRTTCAGGCSAMDAAGAANLNCVRTCPNPVIG